MGFLVFLCSNLRALPTRMPRWDAGMQTSGKILSLDRQGAKKVLEIYVRRSLSCCDSSLGARRKHQEGARRSGGKAEEPQRSKSDFYKYSSAKSSRRKDREEEPKALDPDEGLDDESKAPGEAPKEERKSKRKSSKNYSQRSWFKSFLNFLFKKNPEEQKENPGQKAKGKDAKGPHSSKPDGDKKPGVDSSTCPALSRAPKKRPNLKKVFSFKKNAEEEWGDPTAETRAKRPNCLPLHHRLVPSPPADEEQTYSYYTQVSEEIELMVQGREHQASRGFGEQPQPPSPNGVDEAIRRIVALLQSAGDELDRQVKEDAQLWKFFRDMSYSSFKDLADAYVHREVTASRTNADPQEIQFAYAVHFTAQVAGICNQALNRIMGFGTCYLEESFAPLSHSKILQNREVFSTDNSESPD